MDSKTLDRRVMDTELTLAKLGESCRQAHKRMDELDQLTQNVHTLTNEVHVAITRIKHIHEKMDALDSRLGQLERQPAEDFQFYKRAVVSSLFTGLAGALLGALLTLLLRG